MVFPYPKRVQSPEKDNSPTRADDGNFPLSPYVPSPPQVTGVHPLQMLRIATFNVSPVQHDAVGWLVCQLHCHTLQSVWVNIHDDQFLATVRSMGAVFKYYAGESIKADKFSYKFALVSQSGIMTMFLLTFYGTSAVGKPMFFIWVCACGI